MEEKVNALCVRTVDYRESDRLLTLCTLEKGKILAKIVGCKAPKSKLRFAASPLCFGEYLLNEKNGRYTVTGCTAYDNFYDISSNLEKYYSAFVVTECTERLCAEGDVESCRGLTMLAVQFLTECLEGTDTYSLLARYLISLLAYEGYGLNLSVCSVSGNKLEGQVFYDFTMSGLVNKEKRSLNSIMLSAGALSYLRSLCGNEESLFAKESIRFLADVLCGEASIRLSTVTAFLDL
jgi:DNA repair protein RecO (recombination protein O)